MFDLDDFINYVTSVGLPKLLRMFWFFVIFEFFRYVFIDFVVLILATIKKKRSKSKIAEARKKLKFDNPLISIIVPGKNEGKHLYKLVSSLNEQTYKNYELIIVDDGSDDDTPTIGNDLLKNGKIDMFIRNDVRGGKASAANLALRFTKGEYVVHLDADCSYDRDAIEEIILPFYLDDKVGGVGGNVMVRNYKESLATTLQAVEYLDTIYVGRIVSSYLSIYRVISGAFGAFRKDVIDQIEGWDIGPGLDGDISVKIRKLGYKVKFADEAVCLTSVPNNFKKLKNQRLRWDKSIIRFRVRKHSDVFLPSQNFSFLNFIAFCENIFYNIVLNIKWYFYLADMLFNFLSQIKLIFILNIFLYTLSNYFKYVVFSLFRNRQIGSFRYFLLYIPLMVFYNGYFLRIVRTIAYIQEFFFKKSYKDPWNPQKTSKKAKEIGI